MTTRVDPVRPPEYANAIALVMSGGAEVRTTSPVRTWMLPSASDLPLAKALSLLAK